MKKNDLRTAIFGGGCFWCIEAAYAKLKGVISVVSGYAGGDSPAGGRNPTYEEVCSGKTGHAEVVKIDYDPKIISYADLLAVFFALHDPTTPNRQGADSGRQYRSMILHTDKEQKKQAKNFIEKLVSEKIFSDPIVTEIKPLKKFFPAEDYHQKYFEKNPSQAYCRINIPPKIEKLKEKFGELIE